MVKQVRAERTRQALIAAAAEEFDRQGYAGTSLAAVHRACGVTMGALTFHFHAKADLATAVCREAEHLTRRALACLAPVESLPPVAEFTFVVARLLEEEVAVRAAARLAREQTVTPCWQTVWRSALRELVAPTRRMPGGGGEALADRLELLAVYLTAGAEAALRAGRPGRDVQTELVRLWALVLVPGPLPGMDRRTAGVTTHPEPSRSP